MGLSFERGEAYAAKVVVGFGDIVADGFGTCDAHSDGVLCKDGQLLLVAAVRGAVILAERARAAGTVSEAALHVVEGGEHLVVALQLPAVGDGLQEVGLVVVREGEVGAGLAFGTFGIADDVDKCVVGRVAEPYPMGIHAVAVALRVDVGFVEVVDGGFVASHVCGVMAVDVVLPRSAAVIQHVFEACGELHVDADASQAACAGLVCDVHGEHTGVRQRVVDDVVALVVGDGGAEGGGVLVVAQCGFGERGAVDTGGGVAEDVSAVGRLVLNPADVGVDGLVDGLLVGKDVDVVADKFLDEAVVADDEFHLVARDGIGAFRSLAGDGEFVVAGGLVVCVNAVSVGKSDLLRGDGISGIGIVIAVLQTQFEGDITVKVGDDVVGNFHGDGSSRCGFGEFDVLFIDRAALVEAFDVEEAELVEVGEVELVADDKLVGLVAECHGGGLVDLLHLGKFRRPCPFGGDDAVVEEVALVRAGHVVARNVVGESVGGDGRVEFLGVESYAGNEHVVGNDGGVVDRLVHPVPDATSDS